MEEIVLVYTTWPDAETAQTAAEQAVQARLAACANILAPMTSVYRWEGQARQAVEVPMLLKTRRSCTEALRELLLAAHSYDIPCIAALSLIRDASSAAFIDWIEEETRPPS